MNNQSKSIRRLPIIWTEKLPQETTFFTDSRGQQLQNGRSERRRPKAPALQRLQRRTETAGKHSTRHLCEDAQARDRARPYWQHASRQKPIFIDTVCALPVRAVDLYVNLSKKGVEQNVNDKSASSLSILLLNQALLPGPEACFHFRLTKPAFAPESRRLAD